MNRRNKSTINLRNEESINVKSQQFGVSFFVQKCATSPHKATINVLKNISLISWLESIRHDRLFCKSFASSVEHMHDEWLNLVLVPANAFSCPTRRIANISCFYEWRDTCKDEIIFHRAVPQTHYRDLHR